MYVRLSGILHVLFEALNTFIEGTTPEDEIPEVLTSEISQEEIQMAMALTEYFQAQRQAYDKVPWVQVLTMRTHHNLVASRTSSS